MEDLAIAVWRCCRDWPVVMPTVLGVGKCGLCGQVPEPTAKTLAEYMVERDHQLTTPPASRDLEGHEPTVGARRGTQVLATEDAQTPFGRIGRPQ